MELQTASPAQAAAFVWWGSLIVGLVVSLVVALLLWLICRTADGIDRCASRIWDTGQRVANNTIHIPALYRINEGVQGIEEQVARIERGAAAIRAHAEHCSGCPHCILERG
ncbi:MAG: hypothetical protein OXU61_09105 [Gammaproteobacteria bacterium]|nr:hypothetical protein [Gammaproteobacteria bacterium]MDD9864035.1 hypothetical protein [Gammaproteobacteria bacterium]